MMLALLSVIVVGLGAGVTPAPADDTVMSRRAAQVRLAEVLGSAESIESVSASGRTVTFAIVRRGVLAHVVATTSSRGEVRSLAIHERGPAGAELHGLTWLAEELAEVTAVTRLAVDEDGAVTIATSDGRRYMAIPGRGSGGNTAVEARWAASWSD